MADFYSWIGGTFLQWGICVAVCAPMIAFAGRGKTGVGHKLAILAVFFFGCLLLTRSETFYVFLRSPWQALLLEGAFALAVIILTRSASACGLTMKIDGRAWRDVIIGTLLLLVFVVIRNNLLRYLSLANSDRIPGWEFLLYQATLPGIAEELAYRGVIQSGLNKLLARAVGHTKGFSHVTQGAKAGDAAP